MAVLEADIEELYKKLPVESRCREATNPDRFLKAFNDKGYMEPWPFIGLFQNLEDESLRWLMICDEFYSYSTFLGSRGLDKVVQWKLSRANSTEKPMLCLEVYSRNCFDEEAKWKTSYIFPTQ
ncbi:MAG: hypothetical protein KAT77_04540 [Nanoarchaeota archaeon]|nr:hypothetical protein [Nanoarchaeota archaeon]